MKQQFSNRYIFIFSAIMVTSVAILLSVASMALKPLQVKNEQTAKKTDILKSIYKTDSLIVVKNKNAYIERQYNKYITKTIVINNKGVIKEGIDAFSVDLKAELNKKPEERSLVIYQSTLNDSSKKLIIPVYGKGLWGPIWGYISLYDDNNTIYGAVFDHKSETPGLGAEINTDWFQSAFKNKKIFDETGKFKSVKVYKGGKGASVTSGDLIHGVDGISGGTITSKGVEEMLHSNLLLYLTYLENKNQ